MTPILITLLIVALLVLNSQRADDPLMDLGLAVATCLTFGWLAMLLHGHLDREQFGLIEPDLNPFRQFPILLSLPAILAAALRIKQTLGSD